MVEKVITLENVSLIDFLGIENQNIKEISAAFPKSKIISRGNEIRINGSPPEILRINDILNSLMVHFHKYGKLSNEEVKGYIQREETALVSEEQQQDGLLVYGHKGLIIKPKTPNQAKLVEACLKNDLVFALGPAGTGKTYISVAMAVRALKNKEVKKNHHHPTCCGSRRESRFFTRRPKGENRSLFEAYLRCLR